MKGRRRLRPLRLDANWNESKSGPLFSAPEPGSHVTEIDREPGEHAVLPLLLFRDIRGVARELVADCYAIEHVDLGRPPHDDDVESLQDLEAEARQEFVARVFESHTE